MTIDFQNLAQLLSSLYFIFYKQFHKLEIITVNHNEHKKYVKKS